MKSSRREVTSIAAVLLHRAENLVLILIGVVLIVLALFLLGNSALALIASVTQGAIQDSAINILDSVLLVMMMMEIVYTVAVSLESHELVAEPFLVIGAIAAIRRMLIVTAEATKLQEKPVEFQSILMELGLLALIVVAMAVSIFVLRRSHSFIITKEEAEQNV